ncbi:DUF6225 family protein [Streptomyces violascens]|uniref:Uncharacterized protein n=1 Tax=Streptomyces violascens TaxID=67381 RepID=A0ABQ3QG21_9ACTN|nr:DUF6225 family protein [Streptomyces violascens]GGT88566.1 hypothetical protein GCM10010289_05720 [Streptomyces violascens]GHI36238.1 hypothetical protein Sviol_06460 [Streptomyces violascens]
MTDTYDHTPQVWTAGRLREALAGLSDETPIHIAVADGPGDFEGYSEYALVDLEPVEKDFGEDAEARTEVEYTLFADYKAGQYHVDLV